MWSHHRYERTARRIMTLFIDLNWVCQHYQQDRYIPDLNRLFGSMGDRVYPKHVPAGTWYICLCCFLMHLVTNTLPPWMISASSGGEGEGKSFRRTRALQHRAIPAQYFKVWMYGDWHHRSCTYIDCAKLASFHHAGNQHKCKLKTLDYDRKSTEIKCVVRCVYTLRKAYETTRCAVVHERHRRTNWHYRHKRWPMQSKYSQISRFRITWTITC